MELLLIVSSLILCCVIWHVDVDTTNRYWLHRHKKILETSKPESLLSLVSRCDYHQQKVLSNREFQILGSIRQRLGRRYYLFPQVRLAHFLQSDEGVRALNVGEVDLLIVDFEGNAIAAIEFHPISSSHDAIKRAAIQKAQIACIVINDTDDKTLDCVLEGAGLLRAPILNP